MELEADEREINRPEFIAADTDDEEDDDDDDNIEAISQVKNGRKFL